MDLITTNPVASLVGNKAATAKAEFDARAGQLKQMAPEIYDAIYNKGTHQVVDFVAVAAKSVSTASSFSDLFKSDDDIATGLASYANGKPPTDEYFLVTAIALLYAVAGGTSDSDVAQAEYGLIHNYMRNGTIKMSQENRVILPEMSMEPFYRADQYVATGDTNQTAGTAITYTMKGVGHIGVYRLQNPKWIVENRKIDVDMKFAAALPTNAAVKMLLFGAKNVRS